jgi:hypothetical protein
VTVVRWGLLVLAALIAAHVQTTWLGDAWPAPHLGLALAAAVALTARPASAVLRAGLVGLVVDLLDPASTVFHLVACAGLAIATWPLRGVLIRQHPITGVAVGAAWYAVAAGADAVLGVVAPGSAAVAGSAAATGVVCAGLIVAASSLPAAWHPAEITGA